jgi:hypothetical protein
VLIVAKLGFVLADAAPNHRKTGWFAAKKRQARALTTALPISTVPTLVVPSL